MSRVERKAMILRDHPDLSLSRQCRLLTISRSSFYYAPRRGVNGGESPEDLALRPTRARSRRPRSDRWCVAQCGTVHSSLTLRPMTRG